MVMMMSVTVPALRAGSIASFSTSSHAADHHELALREVDRPARVVDDREAEGDQRIDGAGGQAAGHELDPLATHGVRTAPATSRPTRCRS